MLRKYATLNTLSNAFRRSPVGLISSMVVVCSCGGPSLFDGGASAEAQDTATSAQAIVGGSVVYYNNSAVAVYVNGYSSTFGFSGWLGICSGNYLGTVDGWAVITTAGHCIVDNDTSVDRYRVTTDNFPGDPWEIPPGKAAPPHLSTPGWVEVDTSIDRAVMFVWDDATFRSGLQSTPANSRPGLTFTDRTNLDGATFYVDGYGSQCEGRCQTGVLKRLNGLAYRGPLYQPSSMQFSSSSANGIIANGDSGSGLIKAFGYRDSRGLTRTWQIEVGVVYTMEFAVATSYVAEFVQSKLGFLFLSPMSSPNNFLVLDGSPRMTTLPSTAGARIFYDNTTKLLSDSSRSTCLDGYAMGVACNSGATNQQWAHTGDLQLRNMATNTCLDPNGTYGHLRMVSCNAVAEQAWVFRVSTQ